VRKARVLRQQSYFTRNWELVPDSAVGPALNAMRQPFDAPASADP
jgi:hypothetical protein